MHPLCDMCSMLPVVRRFVAGKTTETAIRHVQECAPDGVNVMLNHLGEHYDTMEPVDADMDEYSQLIEALGNLDLATSTAVSVKPSQLGADIHPKVFPSKALTLANRARENDVFLWIDMEDHKTTNVTLDAFRSLSEAHGDHVGVCVQANLRRTRSDLHTLSETAGKVRLVKGAYNEPESVALTGSDAVDEAYKEHLEFMFREFDDGIAVGSHDPEMIDHAIALHDEHQTSFEIQMLMGVREEEQRRLAAEGYEVWQYAPYGSKWPSYVYRRLREQRKNVWFILRALLGD